MTQRLDSTEQRDWWASLNHGGLLLSPSKLDRYFSAMPPALSYETTEALRTARETVLNATNSRRGDAISSLLKTLLEDVLELRGVWLRGSQVSSRWSVKAITREVIRPRRIWIGANGAALPVFVTDFGDVHDSPADTEAYADDSGRKNTRPLTRLGVGRGRRAVARVLEWLRRGPREAGRLDPGRKSTGADSWDDVPHPTIALLTNGIQWRILHAGLDSEAWCEADISLWFQQGEPGPQVTALRQLLGPRALTPPAVGKLSPLLDAIQASRKGQSELSDALGERVRQAVELLIQASSPTLQRMEADAARARSAREGQLRDLSRRDLYRGATRMLMRCVVLLFAESREDLLPLANTHYFGSYSLQGLREQLDRQSGGRAAERLRFSYSAWPRLLSLCRLVYFGSAHPELTVPRFGGGLFRPGDATSDDAISRAVAVFEDPSNEINDAIVHQLLEFLTRCRIRVRQGRSSRLIDAPVDFSDLGSEYIGILYEGLLEYELRAAEAQNPIVFLNVGDQPALPFMHLNGMNNAELAQLFEKLAAHSQEKSSQEDEGPETPEAAPDPNGQDDADPSSDADGLDDPDDSSTPTLLTAAITPDAPEQDMLQQVRALVQDWAERAVKAIGLVRPPKKNDPRALDAWHTEVTRAARQLVKRIVLPGEYFLIRWGGTRKGAGTFYTRPQLASPTLRRTLEPLCYTEVPSNQSGERDALTPPRIPRAPNDIIQLTVCDPAMGSGSFLVGALRYLAEALFESLLYHGWLERTDDGLRARLDLVPEKNAPPWFTEALRNATSNDDEGERRFKARLKRIVVERCLYGVDLDPLAVELARVSLWVETLNKELPFEFLDHKLKCGNALIGCWLNHFADYPIMAWMREGGDKAHTSPVNHFRLVAGKGKKLGQVEKKGDVWNLAIQDRVKALRDELIGVLEGQGDLFVSGIDVKAVHALGLEYMTRMHELSVQDSDARAEAYEAWQRDSRVIQLKEALHTWCALWFWPGDRIDECPGPRTALQLSADQRATVLALANEHHFFHWEFEFPDVFNPARRGFDAVIGNPPWEIQKPNSMEFFSNIDPLYRTYGKQEALEQQRGYFSRTAGVHQTGEGTSGDGDGGIERQWLTYNAILKARANFVRWAGEPFGDRVFEGPEGTKSHAFHLAGRGHRAFVESSQLHQKWKKARDQRIGYADPLHPFRHQGSADINTYKMFLELGHSILQQDGRMSLILPSGIYSDKGSSDLRTLLTHHSRWTHLYVFQNERFVFSGIHHSFKMAIPTLSKGGKTEAIQTRFRVGPGDSPESHEIEADILDDARYLSLSLKSLETFSPKTHAILEIRSEADRRILEKLYTHGVLLGDSSPEGWGITYATEFHMTNDSKLFPPRPVWEAQGYRPDEYGHWLKGPWRDYSGPKSILERDDGLILSPKGTQSLRVEDVEGVALPLYQGIMMHQYDPTRASWISGTGIKARWEPIDWSNKTFGPQFLVGSGNFAEGTSQQRVGFRDIARSTDQRTMIACALPPFPCGNKVPILKQSTIQQSLSLGTMLNSWAFDWCLRNRQGGTSINYFLLEEAPLAPPSTRFGMEVAWLSARVSMGIAAFADSWLQLYNSNPMIGLASLPWRRLWAITPHERLRLRSMLDAVVAELYGLDFDELACILRECDHPLESLRSSDITRTFDPKGFWRVDRELDPELRHPVLTLIAFRELKRVGLDAFLALNDGEGWMLPETLRLSDHGLGHDARSREEQPVASRLGPRFLPWQLEQGVAESWEECRRHARLITQIREKGGGQSLPESGSQPLPFSDALPPTDLPPTDTERPVGKREKRDSASGSQLGLFGGLAGSGRKGGGV